MEETTEKEKLFGKIILIVTILLIASLVLNVILFMKNNKDKVDVHYLEHSLTATCQYDNFGIKTLIVQVIDDNGNVFDIIDEQYISYYFSPNTPLVKMTREGYRILNKTNVLKLYYEYNIRTSGGTVYNVSEFLQLPIEIRSNQVYFKTLSNQEFNGINRGVIYFQRSLNFELEIAFKSV